MAKYRAPHLDLSSRMEIVVELLLPANKQDWGRITQLARARGLSRTRLYQLKAQAKAALAAVLAPQNPGPKPVDDRLVVDEAMIKRAISIFPLVKGSIRDIQIGLALLFGIERSVGYIQQTLQEAGARAADYNAQVVTTQPVLAEADEIFQGRRPCLTIVDGRSFRLRIGSTRHWDCSIALHLWPNRFMPGYALICKCIAACPTGSRHCCNCFGIIIGSNAVNVPAQHQRNWLAFLMRPH